MRRPFTLTSRHVAELAAKDREIAEKDETIRSVLAGHDFQKQRGDRLKTLLDDAHVEIARLRKYEPVRDPVTNRFVGKGTPA